MIVLSSVATKATTRAGLMKKCCFWLQMSLNRLEPGKLHPFQRVMASELRAACTIKSPNKRRFSIIAKEKFK